jgi:hypothetical protein
LKGIIAFVFTLLIFCTTLVADSEEKKIVVGDILTVSRVSYYTLSGKTKSGEKTSSVTAATSRLDLLPLGTKFKVVEYETEIDGKKVWIKLKNPRTRVCEDTMKGYWPKSKNDRRKPPAFKIDLWCKKPTESMLTINGKRIKVKIISLPKKELQRRTSHWGDRRFLNQENNILFKKLCVFSFQ